MPRLGSTLAVQDALALANAVSEHGTIAGAAAYSTLRLCAVPNYLLLQIPPRAREALRRD